MFPLKRGDTDPDISRFGGFERSFRETGIPSSPVLVVLSAGFGQFKVSFALGRGVVLRELCETGALDSLQTWKLTGWWRKTMFLLRIPLCLAFMIVGQGVDSPFRWVNKSFSPFNPLDGGGGNMGVP